MHTWVEWKQKQDDKVMRRYFDNPKDAIPFAKRMQREGYHFIMTPQSLVWHFAARGSHFTEDDFTKKSPRQIKAEQDNMRKWISKWGSLPNYDKATFVMPIDNPNVPNRISDHVSD